MNSLSEVVLWGGLGLLFIVGLLLAVAFAVLFHEDETTRSRREKAQRIS